MSNCSATTCNYNDRVTKMSKTVTVPFFFSVLFSSPKLNEIYLKEKLRFREKTNHRRTKIIVIVHTPLRKPSSLS